MPKPDIWSDFRRSADLFTSTFKENPFFSERLNPSLAIFVPDSLSTLEGEELDKLARHPLVQPALRQIYSSRFFHNGYTQDEQTSIKGFAVSYTCLKNYLGRKSPTNKEGTLTGEGTGLPVVLAATEAIDLGEGAFFAATVDAEVAKIQRDSVGEGATLIVRGEAIQSGANITRNRALFTEIINQLEIEGDTFYFTRFLRDVLEVRISSQAGVSSILKDLNSKMGVSAVCKNGIPRRSGRMDAIRPLIRNAARRIEFKKPRKYRAIDEFGRKIADDKDAQASIENFNLSRIDWFDPVIRDEMQGNGIRRTVNLPYRLPKL